MTNTLGGSVSVTALIPTLYDALDVISRELVGFTAACYRNSSAERAAKDQSVTYPVVGAATTGDIAPGTTAVDDGDQTIGYGEIKITKSKYSPVRWAGEEARSIGINGMINPILRDQFAQSMRALVNLIEIDLWQAAYQGASRVPLLPAAGTAPFGTANDLTEGANVRRILEDNGCPTGDIHLVLGSAAMANIRGKQSVLFKVNESGTSELLRQGTIGELQGFQLHNSAAIKPVTKGTGTSYTTNGSTAIGVSAITVQAGSNAINVGDIVTFAADTVNGYMVTQAVAAAGDVLKIGAPGARVVIATGNAITVGNDYTPNIAMGRHALHLVTRAPAMPDGGDSASDVTEVTDPVSGLTFQIAVYRQYRRVKYEVGIAWGCKAVKQEHIAVLRG